MSSRECIWADKCSVAKEECGGCEYMNYYDTYSDERINFYTEWNSYLENFYN